MLNGLLRQQFLHILFGLEEFKGRGNDAVEEEGEVHQQDESDNLKPLERLPAEAERDNPNKECTAGVDGRARSSADRACDRKAKEVEAARRLSEIGSMGVSEFKEKYSPNAEHNEHT